MKALAVGLVLLAAPLSAAPPEISFEPDAVVARGITSKGQAVWFSVAREISRRSIDVVPRHAIAVDEDGDGAVRLELGREVPLRSVWFAVDLATGETAVAVPEGFPSWRWTCRATPSRPRSTGWTCDGASHISSWYGPEWEPGSSASATAGKRMRTASPTAPCAASPTAERRCSPNRWSGTTWKDGTQRTTSLGSMNVQGLTLPSAGTATGREPAFSTVAGTTEVYVDATLQQDQQSATIAGELGAHALPALLGQGAAPLSDADHHLREDPLTTAARANAQQPP